MGDQQRISYVPLDEMTDEMRAEMERFSFVEALVETGRLGQWDEDDRGAIDHAVTTILSDWHVSVTRDGVDPIASDIVRRNRQNAG